MISYGVKISVDLVFTDNMDVVLFDFIPMD